MYLSVRFSLRSATTFGIHLIFSMRRNLMKRRDCITMGGRYYEPRLGLWISCDPEEENYPAFNSYCYTANNPIRYIDTDGEKIVSPRGNIAVTLDRNGKFHFTSNATASIKRVTKAK
jgi:RHS repeat-associated protein